MVYIPVHVSIGLKEVFFLVKNAILNSLYIVFNSLLTFSFLTYCHFNKMHVPTNIIFMRIQLYKLYFYDLQVTMKIQGGAVRRNFKNNSTT